jgi:hypothetical protein
MADIPKEIIEEAEKLGVTEENKIDFFKSFLADKPYVEKFQLFDGQATVTFKSLSSKETKAIFDQLKKDERNLALTNDPSYAMTLSNYRVGMAIISMDDEELAPDVTLDNFKPDDEDDSYVKSRASLLDNWNVFKVGAITDAFNKFESKLMFLTNHIQTRNFWKAVK